MDSLGKARMSMNRSLDVFGTGLKLHRQHSFGYQLARHWSDDVNTKHLVVVLGRNDLYHAIQLLHRPGTATGSEGE